MMFHWITVYDGVLTNLMSEDREEAVAVLDDDDAFDRWMANYQRKSKVKASAGNPNGGKRISNEQYVKTFAKVHGGDEE